MGRALSYLVMTAICAAMAIYMATTVANTVSASLNSTADLIENATR